MKTILTIIISILITGALAAQKYRTLKIGKRLPLPESIHRATVSPPKAPIYVLHKDGRPLLSKAGYLQLADEGPGFYYGALLKDRVDRARAIGMVGTNNWGAVEPMCFIGHVVEIWHQHHPAVRLGIDEISSRLGGFPDYNGDGISDHLTHQAGMNINLYLPCKKRPELTIHMGRGRNEKLYDVALYGELIDLVTQQGAFHLTTNANLGLFDDASRAAAWKEVKRSANGYAITYQHANGHAQMYLLTPKGDHGDHVNVIIWKGN